MGRKGDGDLGNRTMRLKAKGRVDASSMRGGRADGEARVPRRRIAGAAAVALAVAVFALDLQGDGMWFAHSMLDRINPFAEEELVFARTPAADSFFHSYEDASGAYDNYVYRLSARDSAGEVHDAYLISFGGKLPEAGGWIRARAKGVWVSRFESVGAESVPAPARSLR